MQLLYFDRIRHWTFKCPNSYMSSLCLTQHILAPSNHTVPCSNKIRT